MILEIAGESGAFQAAALVLEIGVVEVALENEGGSEEVVETGLGTVSETKAVVSEAAETMKILARV